MNATATATHRKFRIEATRTFFGLTELPPTTDHPLNWAGAGEYTADTAWRLATSQALPVVLATRDGKLRNLGVMFNVASYERACYNGYVAYGRLVAGSGYRPLAFAQWVAGFRRHPNFVQSDAPAAVRNALPLYRQLTGR